jgi:signal transduction histidine kinase
VKYFVELHGGTIEVKSEMGIETKFLVKLINQ